MTSDESLGAAKAAPEKASSNKFISYRPAGMNASGARRRKMARRIVRTLDLRAGDVVADKYTLVECLAVGGMGAVWVARNDMLDMEVALKFIRPDISAMHPEEASQRLLVEARAIAKLSHPSSVRVLDFGTTPSNDAYIVMELLKGGDLTYQIDVYGYMGAIEAVRTVLPVVEALVEAHELGVVHRDVKPDNVVMAMRGDRVQPTLIDFGIAKLLHKEDARITREGSLLGSPGYMAPEAVVGRPCGAAADIWGLCVLIYELASGALPFDGATQHVILQGIVARPPVSLLDVGVHDDALWNILERGLKKAPNARWKSARALGDALIDWLLAHGIEEDASGNTLKPLRQSTYPGLDSRISGDYVSGNASAAAASTAKHAAKAEKEVSADGVKDVADGVEDVADGVEDVADEAQDVADEAHGAVAAAAATSATPSSPFPPQWLVMAVLLVGVVVFVWWRTAPKLQRASASLPTITFTIPAMPTVTVTASAPTAGALPPARLTVRIDSRPAGASLFVNGSDSGQRAPATVALSAGDVVEARAFGHRPARVIIGRDASSIDFRLIPLAAGDGAAAALVGGWPSAIATAAPTATVTVTAAPAPAPQPNPPNQCDPPYYFDSDGIQHFKKECL